MYKTSEFRGIVRDAIRFRDMRGTDLYNAIKTELPLALKENGIPFSMWEDFVKSGGIFGSKNPMLIIGYPDAPTQFFDIGILVNDNVVSFPLLGESIQNTKLNKKKYLEEEGNLLRAAMVNPDEFILQQELAWNRAVMDAFDSISSDE